MRAKACKNLRRIASHIDVVDAETKYEYRNHQGTIQLAPCQRKVYQTIKNNYRRWKRGQSYAI